MANCCCHSIDALKIADSRLFYKNYDYVSFLIIKWRTKKSFFWLSFSNIFETSWYTTSHQWNSVLPTFPTECRLVAYATCHKMVALVKIFQPAIRFRQNVVNNSLNWAIKSWFRYSPNNSQYFSENNFSAFFSYRLFNLTSLSEWDKLF